MKSPYRQHGENHLIELRLYSPKQLFNTLDPSPFHEKDLDAQAERYIVDAVHELPEPLALKILVHLPAGDGDADLAHQIPDAIANYFTWQAQQMQQRLREHWRRARSSLLASLSFLAACLLLSGLASRHAGDFLAGFLSEGLLVIGWVAMWRPVDMLIYGWRPLRAQLRTLQRISQTPVELRTATGAESGAGAEHRPR